MDARAYLAMARLDLGALLQPSIEGRRLLDHALTAADELGMTSLAKQIATPPRPPKTRNRLPPPKAAAPGGAHGAKHGRIAGRSNERRAERVSRRRQRSERVPPPRSPSSLSR
jgi:hypothetical protein